MNLIQFKGSMPLPGQVQNVAVQGEQLYVALGESGVAILDADTLKLQAAYDTVGQVQHILPLQAEMAVADGTGGLLMLQQIDYVFQTFMPVIARK